MVIVVVGALAVTACALLRQPSIRRRVDEAARNTRERWSTMRTPDEGLEIEPDAPASLHTEASTEAGGFGNATEDAGPMTPTNLDPDISTPTAADGDPVPAFEETGKPI
jgi:hypothetical protein